MRACQLVAQLDALLLLAVRVVDVRVLPHDDGRQSIRLHLLRRTIRCQFAIRTDLSFHLDNVLSNAIPNRKLCSE